MDRPRLEIPEAAELAHVKPGFLILYPVLHFIFCWLLSFNFLLSFNCISWCSGHSCQLLNFFSKVMSFILKI